MVASIALLPLLVGCDDGDDESRDASGGRPTKSTSTSPTTTPSLSVQMRLDGTYSRVTVHFIRVERPDGASVLERKLSPERGFATSLEPGEYRLLSFQRQCKAECGDEPEPSELGEPIDLCGTYFSIPATGTTTLTVKLVPDVGCEIETA